MEEQTNKVNCQSNSNIDTTQGLNGTNTGDVNKDITTTPMKFQKLQSTKDDEQPWWRADLSLLSPTLFGTWDGVFTSCMVNIFGVVIFLRTGWIVGNSGFDSALVMIVLTESVSVVTVLSAIGICHEGRVECTGGVYTLISHVLGSKLATPVALLYCLGQAISCSLCVLAFAESILDLLGWKNIWFERLIAWAALLFILGVLALGLRWLIGLQIFLIILLFIAVFDFLLGSFITTDPASGVIGYSREVFINNTGPGYTEEANFFSVLGVFFPMSCGVLAGFQMVSDVKDPPSEIPKGTMAAILVSSAIYLVFAFVFSFTCTRDALRTDYMIAEKVSATRVLWLIGLYQLSLSSAVGNLCGCPTALMGVAADRVIAVLNPLAKGSGPNKIPFLATSMLAGVSAIFLLFGHLNSLSVITTVLYLIAYAFVNYSHFELCMSVRQNVCPEFNTSGNKYSVVPSEKDKEPSGNEQTTVTRRMNSDLKENKSSCATKYGSISTRTENNSDPQKHLDLIFEASNHWTFAAFSHPFISLIGAICCLMSSLLIDWMFTLISLLCVLLVWFLIGIFNPGVPTGAARFSYIKWAKKCLRPIGRTPVHETQLIIMKPPPKLKMHITRQSMPTFDFLKDDSTDDAKYVKTPFAPIR